MTDNEIVKALPKVLYGGHGCRKCKYDNGEGDDRCGIKGCKIARSALDLITRQRAELNQYAKEQHDLMIEKDELFDIAEKQKTVIDRLKYGYKKLVEKQKLYRENTQATREFQIEQAKAEAIREFAERLKETAYTHSDITGYQSTVVDVSSIDNLVKEMVGEDNG